MSNVISIYPLKKVVKTLKPDDSKWTLYTLECGHTQANKRSKPPANMRCPDCFKAQQRQFTLDRDALIAMANQPERPPKP